MTINYEPLSGSAGELAPRELLEQALDTLLASVGVPMELYRSLYQPRTRLGRKLFGRNSGAMAYLLLGPDGHTAIPVFRPLFISAPLRQASELVLDFALTQRINAMLSHHIGQWTASALRELY